MKCPYCDTEFDTEGMKAMMEEEEKRSSPSDKASFEKSETMWEEDGSRHYICHSCGGEIIAMDTEAALLCPWCGNPVVMTDQYEGMLRPDLVIPFKNGKEEAKEAFYNHLKGKKLVPPVFRDKAHIDEIKGVYVPVWFFDATIDAHMSFPATRTRVWSDSRFTYTRISHYRIIRDGHMELKALPVDGSTKMPDSLMEPLGPWNLDEAVDYMSAYLSGYLADRYDVDSDESSRRVVERAKSSAEKRLLATTGPYVRLPGGDSTVEMKNGKEKYVLLPVWILRTEWEGKNWYYSMNGQNGKMVGDLPVDKSLRNKYFALSSLAFGALGALVTALVQIL
ncbi:MAG: hypothetical protein ACI4S4_02465 [Candidatus Ornithospirochaeta sp.]